MIKLKDNFFKPIPENKKQYDALYEEYNRLFEFFGKENAMMKWLRNIGG